MSYAAYGRSSHGGYRLKVSDLRAIVPVHDRKKSQGALVTFARDDHIVPFGIVERKNCIDPLHDRCRVQCRPLRQLQLG